jgi:serine/threonine protein kinase
MNKDNLSLGNMNTQTGDEINKSAGQLLFIGDEIGSYKVIKQLGAGGMGQVYLVENVQMRKQYALKVLPPHLSQNQNFIDRFRVEARVMADLEHPNIVGVMNIGHDKERKLYYLVMQYVSSENSEKLLVNGNQLSDENILEDGTSAELCSASDLEELLKNKKQLKEDYVLKITRQLCSALDYAHNFRGKGIVHRDLKPSNILLDSEGNAHIADFGLAKVVGQDYLKSIINRSMRLTMAGGGGGAANMSIGDMNTMIEGEGSSQTTDHGSSTSGSRGTVGSLIGTYEYMAPEQQDGEEATVQSDIYSLGLIIYRMLTGRKAKGRFKLPSQRGCSKYWDKIISNCLEEEPEDRFELVEQINKLLPKLKKNKVNKKSVLNKDHINSTVCTEKKIQKLTAQKTSLKKKSNSKGMKYNNIITILLKFCTSFLCLALCHFIT